MNAIDLILLSVLGISIAFGAYHGFILSAANLLGLGLSIAMGFLLGPVLAKALSGIQGLSGMLTNYSDAVVRVGDYELANAPVASVSTSMLDTVLGSVALPTPIEQVLKDNIITRVFQGRGLATINEYVSKTLIDALIGVLSFLICCFLFYLLWTFLASLIKQVFELPILKQMDWLAGALFGLARGALICYLLVLLLPLIRVIVPGDQFKAYLDAGSIAGIFQSDGLMLSILRGN